MSEQYIFTIYGLNKYYDTKHVLKDINLCFFPGAKIGIVGDNGSGKTTLLKIMAGLDNEFVGDAAPAKNIKIGFVQQEPVFDKNKNVKEIISEAFAESIDLLKQYDEVSEKMATDISQNEMDKCLNRMTELQEKIDAINGWEIDTQLKKISNMLLLPPDDLNITKLSGGEKRRVALCKVLLEQPDILLLDEPTNHLDAETVEWLETQLKDYPGTVIISTHDRYFLDNVTKWILELDKGKGIPFEGNYSSWLEQKSKKLEIESKSNTKKIKFLQNELEWINSNKKGKNYSSKNRLNRYQELKDLETKMNENSLEIQIAPGPPLGKQVLIAKKLEKNFGKTRLINDLSFELPQSAIVGLIGPNGTGKTTLFKMIVGEEQPDKGEIELGETVKLAYVDQTRDNLNNSKTIFEEISGNEETVKLGNYSLNSRAYVSRFNFKGSDQQKLVGNLSGGERNRVHLAKLLKTGGNLILLDEPTNDLDISTLRNLEEAILSFAGCIMLISHDRFFLDRICTHLLVFEGDDKIRWFEGNFHDYEKYILNEFGKDKISNRRARYKYLQYN
jgi:energy-dependent translational throttle protein EttA